MQDYDGPWHYAIGREFNLLYKGATVKEGKKVRSFVDWHQKLKAVELTLTLLTCTVGKGRFVRGQLPMPMLNDQIPFGHGDGN